MHIPTFPVLKNTTYLNTAYVGPMSSELYEFRRKHEEDYVQKGSDYRVEASTTLEKTHQKISHFFGVSEHHCFAVSNFSAGIRFALSALPKSFKILHINQDYPSLLNGIKEQGFTTKGVPLNAFVEQSIDKELEQNHFDVLALSLVQYTNGLLIDFEFLKNIKERYPHLLIIGDGTQFLGAHPFRFDSSPFDVLVCSGYKWLLAGFGNGVLMFSDAYLDAAKSDVTAFKETIFAGHFNILSIASLLFAIEQLELLDFNALMMQKKRISNRVAETLTAEGFLPQWVTQRPQHSSIFSFKGDSFLFQHLMDAQVKCAQRGDGVRVSFHFYNTEEDLQILVAALKKFYSTTRQPSL